MRQALEAHLWDRIGSLRVPGEKPREVIADMLAKGLISSPKQAWATLAKWTSRGWYDYGVALDLGWKTGDGMPVWAGGGVSR